MNPLTRTAGMGLEPGYFCSLVVPVSKTAGIPIRLQSAYFGAFDAFSCRTLLSDEFERMALEPLILGLCSRFRVEPAVGVEPTTCGLQNRCSTTELCRRIREGSIVSVLIDSATGFPRLHRFKTELQSVVI